jgi:hypothetical protein
MRHASKHKSHIISEGNGSPGRASREREREGEAPKVAKGAKGDKEKDKQASFAVQLMENGGELESRLSIEKNRIRFTKKGKERTIRLVVSAMTIIGEPQNALVVANLAKKTNVTFVCEDEEQRSAIFSKFTEARGRLTETDLPENTLSSCSPALSPSTNNQNDLEAKKDLVVPEKS